MDNFQIIPILQLSSIFLSLEDSLNLLVINSTCNKHLPNTYFKRNISILILRKIFKTNASEEILKHSIQSLLALQSCSYDTLYHILIPSHNLIKNSRLLHSYSSWKVDYDTLHTKPWYSLKQVVILPKFPNRLLVSKLSIYHKHNIDCDAELLFLNEFSCPILYKYIKVHKQTPDSYITHCIIKQSVPQEVLSITCILKVIGSHYFLDNSVYFHNLELRIFRSV